VRPEKDQDREGAWDSVVRAFWSFDAFPIIFIYFKF
jgi:hypothetical protein